LSSIKNSNTPAAKVYNWNILSEVHIDNKLGIFENWYKFVKGKTEINNIWKF